MKNENSKIGFFDTNTNLLTRKVTFITINISVFENNIERLLNIYIKTNFSHYFVKFLSLILTAPSGICITPVFFFAFSDIFTLNRAGRVWSRIALAWDVIWYVCQEETMNEI